MDPLTTLAPTQTEEIDIEFSQWNKTCRGCDADFTVYPSTGNRKPNGVSSWEDNFQVSGGNLTTARMEWRFDRVVFTVMNGVHPIGSVADVIKTETYSSNTTNIPQKAAQLVSIFGASRGRLQGISRQSFAIFDLFRTEPKSRRIWSWGEVGDPR